MPADTPASTPAATGGATAVPTGGATTAPTSGSGVQAVTKDGRKLSVDGILGKAGKL